MIKNSNTNPQEPAEGEEQPEQPFDKWEREQIEQDNLDIMNLRNQAREYYTLGKQLFNARHELSENYHTIIQTNLTDPSKIPREFLNDIFQTQAIRSSAFLETVSETMEPDLWEALKAKHKAKVESGEIISILKSLIDELRYFTFGVERKSKGICLIHRYFKLNLASYVQRCVVDFPEIKPIEELTDEHKKELEETKTKPWMKFTDKSSRFFYILQESQNLIAEEPKVEED